MRLWRKNAARRRSGERQVEALFEFSRKLVGAAGVGEVAHALLRTIDDLLEVDHCLLLTISEDQSQAVGVAALGVDIDVTDIVIDLSEDASVVSRVVRDRSFQRIIDAEHETQQNRRLSELLGIRSALYVPLQTSGGVIAIAVVAMSTRMRTFGSAEVDLAQNLANDAAVAIERARFGQALREVGERELIVASIARAIRESLDPEQVIRTAASELGDHADADTVSIHIMPSEQSVGLSCRWSSSGIECEQVDALAGTLSSSAQLAIDDRQTVLSRNDTEAGPATTLSVPLLTRESVLGVVVLDRPHSQFSSAETALVELIALEISAALEHVRLYQEGRKHLDEQMSLARAAQSLTADLRFDRVLEHLVNEVVKVLRTHSAAFYVYDRDEQTLTLSAAYGESEKQVVGLKTGLVGLAGRVVRTGVTQYTNNYERDIGDEVHPSFDDVVRAIAAPVRWQGDLRGVITVAARAPARLFTTHDVSLLEAFADLASLALHNADAYRAHSRQARIQAGFYRISQVFSSSLSRSETLYALAQAATDALDGDWSLVIGGNGAEDDLHLEGEFAAPPNLGEALTEPAHFVGSPAAVAIANRRVVTSRSVSDDERLSEEWRALLQTNDVASQLSVPVNVNGVHSAVVIVCFERPVRFGDEELVVANNLSTAAGAALERASLFENERRTRRLAQVLADVSALLAETLKSQQVLERIVEQSAVLLDVDACSMAVSRGDEQRLTVHATSGSDEPLTAMLRESSVGGLVEEVARTKRSVGVEELASESGAQGAGGERYDSFLGVPVLHPRGHLIGVLSAYSRRHRRWTVAEISALESFANSAAIAIRNAELYAGVKRERDTIEKLLASIAEGIVATDASGKVTLWNQAAAQITGIDRDHVVGRVWRDVLGLAGDTVVDDGQSVIEARPNGVPMWLSVTASRLREKEHDTGAIYAFRDVTAHYTVEKLKSDFVSRVSYDLRTPLTSIYGFAQTLLRSDLEFDDEDRHVFLEYIATETERLTRIVDNLLQAAQIDAGSVEVHVQRCDVGDVIDQVRQAGIRSSRHQLHVNADDSLVVRADPDKLQRVLDNLVENAVRFSPEGGEVKIDAQRENGAVTISVTDDGMGISPSEQKHLFTRFHVSPQATEHAGSGLGLYISRGLVVAMGGRIGVSSQLGEGSTFTVELPVSN